MSYPSVMLENSAYAAGLGRSGNVMTITFSNNASFRMALDWPTSDLVLITMDSDFNPADERGIYMVMSRTGADPLSMTISLQVQPQSWTQVATTMTISYGAVVQDSTPYTSTVTTFYSESSTLMSSTFMTTITPIPLAVTSTSTPQTSHTRFSSSSSPVAASLFPSSTTPSASPLPSNTTSNDTLSPVAQKIYNAMVANLTLSPEGYIVLQQGPVASQTPIIVVAPYQPDNATYQQMIQDALIGDGLDTNETLVTNAINDLAAAASSPYGITPDMGITEVLADEFELYTGDDTNTNDTLAQRNTARTRNLANVLEAGSALYKRYSFDDFLGDLNGRSTS